jgi:hypothetical protein
LVEGLPFAFVQSIRSVRECVRKQLAELPFLDACINETLLRSQANRDTVVRDVEVATNTRDGAPAKELFAFAMGPVGLEMKLASPT